MASPFGDSAVEAFLRDMNRRDEMIRALTRPMEDALRLTAGIRIDESIVEATRSLGEPARRAAQEADASISALLRGVADRRAWADEIASSVSLAAIRDMEEWTSLSRTVGESFQYVEAIGRRIDDITGMALQDQLAFDQFRQMRVASDTLRQRLLEFDAVETDKARTEAGLRALEALAAWVRSVPPSRVAALLGPIVRQLVIGLLVQLAVAPIAGVIMYHREAESRADDLAWQQRLEQSVAEIHAAIESRAPIVGQQAFFKTTAPRVLRVAPHKDAKQLSTIPDGTVLESLEQQGRWLRVIYLENGSCAPITGWVAKRDLVALPDAEAWDDLEFGEEVADPMK